MLLIVVVVAVVGVVVVAVFNTIGTEMAKQNNTIVGITAAVVFVAVFVVASVSSSLSFCATLITVDGVVDVVIGW